MGRVAVGEFVRGCWSQAGDLYGIGKYGSDAYTIFRGDWRRVAPEDGKVAVGRKFALPSAMLLCGPPPPSPSLARPVTCTQSRLSFPRLSCFAKTRRVACTSMRSQHTGSTLPNTLAPWRMRSSPHTQAPWPVRAPPTHCRLRSCTRECMNRSSRRT